jgi:hypothetical protein
MKWLSLCVAALAAVSVTATGAGAQKGRVIIAPVHVQKPVQVPAVQFNNNRITQVAQVNNVNAAQRVRFSGGVFFQGSGFAQFQSRTFNARLGTWLFFDPVTNTWYYWSARNGGFFPLSYASVVPPNGTPPNATNTLPVQTPPADTTPPVQPPPEETPPAEQTPPPPPPPEQTPPQE